MPVRVTCSFAFVDLCGFTSYTEQEGDAAAVGVLTAFRAIVREAATTWGIRIDKWLGDGVMLVGLDPEALASAVIEVGRRTEETGAHLDIRAGITSGPVMLFEGEDYVGAAVNLAAILCDAARAHEVLATREVAGAVPSVAWSDVGRRPLRGVRREVPLVAPSVNS